MIGPFVDLIVPALLLIIGISMGGIRERAHLRSLERREQQYGHLRVTNMRQVTEPLTVRQAQMVSGQVVIASDYFKTIAMVLRNFFGGESRAATRMLERARREALLRVLEQAERLGADEVWSIRYQTSNINQLNSKKKGAMQAEVFAYATAIIRNEGRAILTDVTCEKCGYNLRGIHSNPVCPECGTVFIAD